MSWFVWDARLHFVGSDSHEATLQGGSRSSSNLFRAEAVIRKNVTLHLHYCSLAQITRRMMLIALMLQMLGTD